MRSADVVEAIRVAMIVLVAYLIIAKFNSIAVVIILAIAFLLDAIDGYFAVYEQSNGRMGFITYLSSMAGNRRAKAQLAKYKSGISKTAFYGPRMDVAGDRITEYVLFAVFVYLNIMPLFVFFVVIIVHSVADAMFGAKGTSSKMKSRFAELVYSSNIGRGSINVIKVVTFAYLSLVYLSNWPIQLGYALAGILVTCITLRGIAEIYESIESNKK